MDRNRGLGLGFAGHQASLSARRAWIEIVTRQGVVGNGYASLSARRAWIEIWFALKISLSSASRSPQGERG